MSLILTRRIGETIVIEDDITVTVVGAKGNQVRLAINAPEDVDVHREEVWQQIQDQRRAAELALIRGLHVVEMRRIEDDTPICWIATKTTSGAEALFLSENPDTPLSTVAAHPVWDPLMICYIDTLRETEHHREIYDALVDAADGGTQQPFLVPMPNSEQPVPVELEGAA